MSILNILKKIKFPCFGDDFIQDPIEKSIEGAPASENNDDTIAIEQVIQEKDRQMKQKNNKGPLITYDAMKQKIKQKKNNHSLPKINENENETKLMETDNNDNNNNNDSQQNMTTETQDLTKSFEQMKIANSALELEWMSSDDCMEPSDSDDNDNNKNKNKNNKNNNNLLIEHDEQKIRENEIMDENNNQNKNIVKNTDDEEKIVQQVWLPTQNVGKDEKLNYDSNAYDMLHQFRTNWPCLSFDVIR